MAKHGLVGRLAVTVWAAVAVFVFGHAAVTAAAEPEPLSITMEEYLYPYDVHLLPLRIQGQDLNMAYMDVRPEEGKANGKTVLLLHGKNFFGKYWGDTIR